MIRTTIELPEGLFIAAKKRAADLRRPLRALIEDGLRSQLASPIKSKIQANKKIHWVTVDGGLPPGLNVADRSSMYGKLQRTK